MRGAAYLIFAALIIVIDQISKWSVTERIIRPLVEGEAAIPLTLKQWILNAPEPLAYAERAVTPFFNIVMVWNKGVSFGLLNNGGDYGPIFLVVLSFVITAFFTVWLFRTQSHAQNFGIALVIAGAIGNVIDRLRFKAVIDFLDFHIAGYHWPAFNVADSCIVGGVILLIIYSLFFEKSFQQPA